jgi:2-oxoglutarate dehydrogenase E1 component
MADLSEGSSFHRVMIDGAEAGCDVGGVTLTSDDQIKRVVICSGKVYFDLVDARAKSGRNDVYLLRLEQFYPWPMKSLLGVLGRFKNAELVWVQEEPKNMGGWTFVDPWIELTLAKLDIKAKRARYIGRPASASTAAGLMSRHLKELQAFLDETFA